MVRLASLECFSVVVTTSHNQASQVASLFENLVSSARIHYEDFRPPLLFVVAESGSETSILTSLKERFPDTFFWIPVSPTCYWTGSVLAALSWLEDYSCDLRFNRIVLMNTDVLPSDWCFLWQSRFQLETVPRYCLASNTYLAGYNINPFYISHSYVNFNPHTHSESFCSVVPTRLVTFDYKFLPSIVQYLSRIQHIMPHYGGDYLLTGFLSSSVGSSWHVRKDVHLIEDFSSSGIKKVRFLNLFDLFRAMYNIKSTFQLRANFLYPWLASINSKSIPVRVLYVFSFYVRYFFRLVLAFFAIL